MKKRMMAMLSLVLAGAMVFPMGAMAGEAEAAAGADEGKVLNIQCWNDEFATRMLAYPGYEPVDETAPLKGGKIGDVTVKFIQTENQGTKYQDALDASLPENENVDADKRTDLFLVEADYSKKYCTDLAGVTLSMDDLGITADDLKDQYKYTQDVVTGTDGKIYGSTWQACSAGMIYRRDIAKEVFGSDDPAEVQKNFADWDAFKESAAKLKDAGYTVVSSVNDLYRIFQKRVTKPWGDGGKVEVDPAIKEWVDLSKELVDAGETNPYDLWGDEWKAGTNLENGKTFSFFGPAWLINFSLGNGPDGDDDGSVSHAGGWGFTTGPEAYNWGGTWIAAAKGTDNLALDADVIKTLTTDPDVMKTIATKWADCVNNKAVLADLAGSEDGNIAILGGQNPYQLLADGAETIDMSTASMYDQGCIESMMAAMKNYFTGEMDYDGAVDQFVKTVQEKYPSLAQ